MARQSVTQHLEVLEAANLVITVRRGREKLHDLNAVPIHEIEERWIYKFERPRLRALRAIKRRAEEAEMTDQPIGQPIRNQLANQLLSTSLTFRAHPSGFGNLLMTQIKR